MASSPVPVKEFLLIEMLYEWGNVFLKLCHLNTEGVAGQRSAHQTTPTNLILRYASLMFPKAK